MEWSGNTKLIVNLLKYDKYLQISFLFPTHTHCLCHTHWDNDMHHKDVIIPIWCGCMVCNF